MMQTWINFTNCEISIRSRKRALKQLYVIASNFLLLLNLNIFQLLLEDDSFNATSVLQKVVEKVEQIDNVVGRYDKLSEEVSEHLENSGRVRKDLSDYLKKIDTLECSLRYMNIVISIDDLR